MCNFSRNICSAAARYCTNTMPKQKEPDIPYVRSLTFKYIYISIQALSNEAPLFFQ